MDNITNDDINRIFGVTESYMLPDRLMKILENKTERERVFNAFLKISPNKAEDWFTDYFQEEHSNRKAMMQDFTPESVRRILSGIVGDFTKCADICAGTGGLTIAMHNKNPEAEFYCIELSKRALPLLIFNLAIRNINATVINQDVLTEEVFGAYQLSKGEAFSDITRIEEIPEFEADAVVMNPPYSLKHKWNDKLPDRRFDDYGYPPSNASDYAFVLHGLNMLATAGTLVAVLPHGVLFRGNREAIIRRKLVENRFVDSVIGLPENLFLNTGIPVFVLKLKRNCRDTLFIDAKSEFRKAGKISIIPDEGIEKIIDTANNRTQVDRFAHVAAFDEIERNEYNLNISRYVDTYEPPPPIDIVKEVSDLKRCEEKIKETDKKILESLKELKGATQGKDEDIKTVVKLWEEMINGI